MMNNTLSQIVWLKDTRQRLDQKLSNNGTTLFRLLLKNKLMRSQIRFQVLLRNHSLLVKKNQVIEKDVYPLPYASAILDRLRDARIILSLDIKSAYRPTRRFKAIYIFDYLDDVIVFTLTFRKYLGILSNVSSRLLDSFRIGISVMSANKNLVNILIMLLMIKVFQQICRKFIVSKVTWIIGMAFPNFSTIIAQLTALLRKKIKFCDCFNYH